MKSVVLDASAAVELVCRTAAGEEVGGLITADNVVRVPDGIFDVEVNATLSRRRVANLVDRAWSLRSNMGKDVARFVRAEQRYPKVRTGISKSLNPTRTPW